MRIHYKCLVLIYVFPEMELHNFVIPKQNYNVLSPNFHIHVSVSDLNIPLKEKNLALGSTVKCIEKQGPIFYRCHLNV